MDDDITDDGDRRTTDRRHLLGLAAATAAGAVGAAALGHEASAATGDNMRIGVLNEGTTTTQLDVSGAPFTDLAGPGPVALELRSQGGHLRFVGTPGDTVFGTYDAGTLAYNSSSGLEIWQVTDTTPKPTLLARPGTAGAFTLLAPPERVYDSRPNSAPNLSNDGVIAAGQTRTIELLASGTEQFIENIDGAMLNVTVTQTVGSGFLSVYSAALTTPPAISTVNWSTTGQTVANLTVSACRFAAIKVTCGGTGSAHFIVDVLGVYG